MKKKNIAIVSLLILMSMCLFTYQYYYGGTNYYVKINQKPVEIRNSTKDGIKQGVLYTYSLTGLNVKGEKLQIQFDSKLDKPIKENAFLKVLVNKKNRVISWEEIQEKNLPNKIKKFFD